MSFFVDKLVNGLMADRLAFEIRRQPPGDLFRTPMYRKTMFNVPLNVFILQSVPLMRLALSLNRSFMSLVAQVASFSNRRSVSFEFPRYRRVIPSQFSGDTPKTQTFRFQDADLVPLLYRKMKITCFFHTT
jgi:hypothetical protein